MSQKPSPIDIDRALRLAALPHLSVAEAARLVGVPAAIVRREKKRRGPVVPSRGDLVLAGLTSNGRDQEGPLGDLASLAGWLDYVNHDGTTAAEVQRDLERLEAEGAIAVVLGRFRLLRPWP